MGNLNNKMINNKENHSKYEILYCCECHVKIFDKKNKICDICKEKIVIKKLKNLGLI